VLHTLGEYSPNIHLFYYPPHHRTYNPVERVWGILENHGNGTLLTDHETVIEWAKTMTWEGISAIVKVLAGNYQTGVKVGVQAFNSYRTSLSSIGDLHRFHAMFSARFGLLSNSVA